MKRLLCFLLAIIMCFSFTACSGVSKETITAYEQAYTAYYQEFDYDKAFSILKDKEDCNYAPILFLLANCFSSGRGTEYNFEESFRLYSLAAEKGNPLAQAQLGYAYLSSSGCEYDPDAADNYFSLAFSGISKYISDNSTAFDLDLYKHYLADLYYSGYGIERDYSKSIELFKQTADNGFIPSFTELGYLLAYGKKYNIEPDCDKAIALFNQAADAGYAKAYGCLADAYFDGIGVERSLEKSIEYYHKAAELGDVNSYVHYSFLNFNGIGKQVSELYPSYVREYDFSLLDEAVARNNSYAALIKGYCLSEGIGVEIDRESAIKYYKKAAEQNNGNALVLLGSLTENYEEALEYFNRAIEVSDYIPAYKWIGNLYAHGLGVEQDIEKAIEYMDIGFQRGDTSAYNWLGNLYYNGTIGEKNYQTALEYYRKAMNEGNGDAAANIGWLFANGEGVKKNSGTAINYFNKAIDFGSAEGYYGLAWSYFSENADFFDLRKAFENFVIAANMGNVNAMRWLGVMSDEFRIVFAEENDFSDYMFWADGYDPSRAGIPVDMVDQNRNKIGEIVFSAEKTMKEAIFWYTAAADRGQKYAANRLAEIYESGYYTDRDADLAEFWHNRAQELGY